jgi:glycine cleavage system H protein
MNIPEGLRYTKDHEWVLVSGEVATVGITEFAQSELGDLVFVDLPALNKGVKAGDTMCVVESTKAASDVYAPITGKVIEVNSGLKESPERVNSDPYGAGWLVKLSDISADEIAGLLDAAGYRKQVGA